MTKVVTSLADVLPAEAVARNADAGLPLGREPEVVARPESTEEVATAVRWAAAQGIGVLPVASGRRLWIAPLDRPYLLLRTDRLTGIEIYEPADLTFTARAGTPLAELGARLGAHRQWLPFDPPHAGARSLGGLVATGESGPLWMGYGELRNHVLGMTVVTGDGRTLRLGGRVVKNVAGFDMLKPMVGSRGRLGVITSVCVRAFPVPAEDRLLVLRGARVAELLDAALAVGTAPVLPVSSTLLEPARSLGARAALLVRLHGSLPTVDADQRALERHCGVSFERPGEAEALRLEARDAASDRPVLTVATLPSRLPEALAAIERAIGDASTAAALVVDSYLGRIRVASPILDAAMAERLRPAVRRLGGALSLWAGPGLGATLAASPAEAELVSGLERVFDPAGVLWPCRA